MVIHGCNTGVPDQRIEDGRTMNQAIGACDGRAANHGKFVECVGAFAREWKDQDMISGREYGRIVSCAARSSPALHRPEAARLEP